MIMRQNTKFGAQVARTMTVLALSSAPLVILFLYNGHDFPFIHLFTVVM